MKIKIDKSIKIFVIPRKLILDTHGQGAISDSETTTKKSLTSFEKIDVSDTRQYQLGDSLKSIHWKLSTKSEDFIVRDYETGSSKETHIYVDLSSPYPHNPPSYKEKNRQPTTIDSQRALEYIDANEPLNDSFYEDMNEYCADGVVELAIGAVLRELHSDNKCSLFWFDSRNGKGICAYTLSNIDDFLMIYNFFSTAPLVPKEKNLLMLCSTVKSAQSTKQIYITSAIDKDSVGDLCKCTKLTDSVNVDTKDVIVYSAIERYKNRKERSKYIQGCQKELSEHGLRLIIGNLSLSEYTF